MKNHQPLTEIEQLELNLEYVLANPSISNEEKERQSKIIQEQIDLYYECALNSFESEHC